MYTRGHTMEQLVTYCKQTSNDMDHRQARILRAYLITSLLGARVGAGYTSDDNMHTFTCQ